MDLNRRRFSGGAAAFASIFAAAARDEEAQRFRMSKAEIGMTIEFHDGYAGQGFWFGEPMSKREYCLSGAGEEGRNCLAGFRGSLAIVRYRARPRSHPALKDDPVSGRHGPWYLFRQDLFLEPQHAPFLTLYGKHASASIRVLDLIPGDQTWLDKK